MFSLGFLSGIILWKDQIGGGGVCGGRREYEFFVFFHYGTVDSEQISGPWTLVLSLSVLFFFCFSEVHNSLDYQGLKCLALNEV